jgi:hypothetical protein
MRKKPGFETMWCVQDHRPNLDSFRYRFGASREDLDQGNQSELRRGVS